MYFKIQKYSRMVSGSDILLNTYHIVITDTLTCRQHFNVVADRGGDYF